MKLLGYIALYGLIALFAVQNQLLLAVFLVLLFTYYLNAVWLIPLAFLIDGYFGAFFIVPVFSIFSVVWYVASEFLKPRLRLQSSSLL